MMVNLFGGRSAGSWAAGGIPRCIRAVAALWRHVEKRRVTQDGLMLRSTALLFKQSAGLTYHSTLNTFHVIIFCPIPPKKMLISFPL